MRTAIMKGHSSYITHIDFSRNSKYLQSNSGDYELMFWDVRNGKQITSASSLRDKEWETWTCTIGWPVQGNNDDNYALCCGALTLWGTLGLCGIPLGDTRSFLWGTLGLSFGAHSVFPLGHTRSFLSCSLVPPFLLTPVLLSSFSRFSSGIWPPEADGTDINSVDRSPDQTLLATADDFGKVKLFRYPAPQPKGSAFRVSNGHSSHVTNVRFLQDGQTVISTGGNDRCIFHWDVVGAKVNKHNTKKGRKGHSEHPPKAPQAKGKKKARRRRRRR
jgi:WD40 repeat protein